jgi:GNAT superfamily N-acetyltransferase
MENDLNIEVHHQAQPDDDSFVRSELDRFNQAAGPFDAMQPLRCFARDPSGTLTGAAIGHIWGTSCELGQLWVAEPRRRQGLGSQLLRRFESEAQSRGCIQVYLDTFSFHAPQFYQVHGYEVACQFAGLPDAAVLYVLRKSLAAA